MIVNADLHIHSPYTKKTDIINNFNEFALNAKKKGLDFIATGDCLHPQWLKSITTLDPIDEGTFTCQDTFFILSSEVQTDDDVHHLLYFPDVTALYDFKEEIKKFNVNFNEGRPYIPLSSELLATIVIDTDSLIGPSHIFDPFSGIYSKYDSLQECYRSATPDIFFVELGLGIDTYHADMIQELHSLTYLTNSDTHNPHPIRLGREFTQFTIRQPRCKYIFEALKRRQDNRTVLNAGIPPEEGKYYQTGCNKCQKHYSYKQARRKKWKCSCGGTIKKGIKERILGKSNQSQSHYPYHRPLYLSIFPLHEILTRALHQQNPFVDTVEHWYQKLISIFGNEIHILLETPIKNIEMIANAEIADMIHAFRMATFEYKKGGGGMYGSLQIKNRSKE